MRVKITSPNIRRMFASLLQATLYRLTKTCLLRSTQNIEVKREMGRRVITRNKGIR